MALTDTTLAALASVGLLKRTRLLPPPTISEADDTVIARYADGVVATLPAARTLRDSPCTCGSLAVCRHRLGAVLAYHQLVGDPTPPGGVLDLAWLRSAAHPPREAGNGARRRQPDVEDLRLAE